MSTTLIHIFQISCCVFRTYFADELCRIFAFARDPTKLFNETGSRFDKLLKQTNATRSRTQVRLALHPETLRHELTLKKGKVTASSDQLEAESTHHYSSKTPSVAARSSASEMTSPRARCSLLFESQRRQSRPGFRSSSRSALAPRTTRELEWRNCPAGRGT